MCSNMVQNYTIVQGLSIQEVMVKVNAMIGMGWQPLGGISTTTTPELTQMFYQAMWTNMTNL